MTVLAPTTSALSACGPHPDAVEACLGDVGRVGDLLVIACLNRWRDERMTGVLAEARQAAARAEHLRDRLADAFAPATEREVAAEGARLLRSWPQAKHGDLAGYGAELAMLIAERRPSHRALQQACRALKLTRVHLPAIAEVIAALDAAERTMQAGAVRLAALPERIARAEAMLVPTPPRSTAEVKLMRAAS